MTTTTERDELRGIIMSPESFDGGPPSCGPGLVYATRIADAILAAGWTKQAAADPETFADRMVRQSLEALRSQRG